MRVALYYPWMYLTSGGERVIVELVRRSRHQWLLFTSHYEPQNTFPELREMGVRELAPVTVKRDVVSTARSALTILRQRLPEDEYDALFVLSEGLGDLILFRNRRRPSLSYCLTPLRAAFDPVYREQAYGKRGALGRAALRMGLAAFAAADRAAWKRYTRMLFISRETVNRATKGRLIGRHQPEILYPGVGLAAERPSQQFERYFLIPGRIMWTKHIQMGIRAFQQVTASHKGARDFRLVIAGMVDAKSRAYLDELKAAAGGDVRVEIRLSPSDAELRDLYQRCYAVLFTPLNEDLGIVPIEAMAFGKPVIAVNQGGPAETIEHGVQGFLADPAAESFAHWMAVLLEDEEVARAMGRRGFERAPRYSWDRFVDRVDELVDQITDAACHSTEAGLAGRAGGGPDFTKEGAI